MSGTLEKLLERIRDEAASADDVARARDLVRGDARLPDELREIGLTDDEDLVGDAVGLLAVLGAAPLFGDDLRDVMSDVASDMVPEEVDDGWEVIAEVLREGLVEAARDIDVASAVMMRLPPAWVYGPATAQAVASEAGSIDVAADAMSALGVVDSLESLVADAVHHEAGAVDVVSAVFEALALADASVAVAEAVRAEAGEVDVVAAVLAEVGDAPSLQVLEAVRAEAGQPDLADEVSATLAFSSLPVGEAVRSEGGAVDLAAAVAATLAFEPVPVAEAVQHEAGAIDVVADVAQALAFEPLPLREAVVSEAGAVDLADAVCAVLFEAEGAPAERAPAAATMPQSVQAAPTVPVPVNRSAVLGAVLMAAVALLMFAGLSQWAGTTDGETPDARDEIVFAAAGDVVVEDLDYADDVVVMQAEGDEGAVILWMEGA